MHTVKREGRRQAAVNDQPNALDSTEDGTSGIKKYHVLQLAAYRTVFHASSSMAL